jgi:RimJ/RimL family protein N-acetyltransferase
MVDFPLPIFGDQVIIRRLCEANLLDLYALETDPKVKRYLGGPVTRLRDEWVAGMRGNLDQSVAVIAKATQCFAGTASLTCPGLPLHESELRVLIARQYWGRRFGREVSRLLIEVAFGPFGACSLLAVVHPDNKASLDLCKELGFLYEGKRQYGAGMTRWDNGYCVLRLSKTP